MGGVMLHLQANTRETQARLVGRQVGSTHPAGVKGLNPSPKARKDKDIFSSGVLGGKPENTHVSAKKGIR